MSTVDLLSELRQRNAFLSCKDGRILVDAPVGALTEVLVQQLRERKELLLQVLWRVDTMRSQAPRRGSVPLLIARDLPPRAGYCVSCGEPVAADNPGRCGLCVTAAAWVLREREYAAGSGASDEG